MALNFPAQPADGQVYENFVWNQSVGAWQVRSLFELNEITDVNAPAPTAGDLLYYNGEEWINASPKDVNIGSEDLSALFWMYA